MSVQKLTKKNCRRLYLRIPLSPLRPAFIGRSKTPGKLLDLALYGASVLVKTKQPKIGDILSPFIFTLNKREFKLKGVVRSLLKTPKGMRVGIEFTDISSNDVWDLAQWVALHKTPQKPKKKRLQKQSKKLLKKRAAKRLTKKN